jgi:hypothetical protein
MLVDPGEPTLFVLMPPDVVLPASRVQRAVWLEPAARLPRAWPLANTSTTHEFDASVVTLVEVAPLLLKLALDASGADCLTL